MEKQSETVVVHNVEFNHDYTGFGVATDRGFMVYRTSKLKRIVERDIDGSLKAASMLYRTNIIGMVGGGLCPKYSPTKLILWDDLKFGVTGELTLIQKVKSFVFRRDVIVVVLEDKLMVFNFDDLELLRTHETISNPDGIIALNTKGDEPIIAMLSVKRGFGRISHVNQNKEVEIECHQTNIKYLTLNPEGSLLATASIKGTLIRIFETTNGDPLKELRRGSENADIEGIAFSLSSTYLAGTSDKGTAHMFSLFTTEAEIEEIENTETNDEDVLVRRSVFTTTDENVPKNKRSMLSFFSKILPKYYSSEWSFAQYVIGGGKGEITKGGFTKDDELVLISTDGTFSHLSVAQTKGKPKVILKTNFLDL